MFVRKTGLFVALAVFSALSVGARTQLRYFPASLRAAASQDLGRRDVIGGGLNSHGDVSGVVGYDYYAGIYGTFAFVYQNGRLDALPNFYPIPYYQGSGVRGLNDADETTAVGQLTKGPYDTRAYLLSGGGAYLLYPNAIVEDNTDFLYPAAINNSSQIIFNSYSSFYAGPYGSTAFFYSGGQVAIIPSFGTGLNSEQGSFATGINNAGQVVGMANVYDSSHTAAGTAAFLWQNGVLSGFQGFGTDLNNQSDSKAYAINDVGQVALAGTVYDANHQKVQSGMFLWQNGLLTNLDPSGTYALFDAHPSAINNAGDVTGNLYSPDIDGHNSFPYSPFLYHQGHLYNLNTLIPANFPAALTGAIAINDRGQILCLSDAGPTVETYLLNPVHFAGDFTSDGLPDLLWQNSGKGLVGLWAMNVLQYGGYQQVATGVTSDWKIAATPDLNGDGSPDIVWRNSKTGDVAYWLRHGSKPVQAGMVWQGLSLDWQIVGTGDFNDDGSADIALHNTTTGKVVVWYMDGVHYAQTAALPAADSEDWQPVAVADLNGDYKPDLVWRNSKTGDVAYWLLNGAKRLDYGVLAANVPLDWQVVAAADYNGDGNTDLILQNSKAGSVYVWLMNGTRIANIVPIGSEVNKGWQIVGPR